MSALNPNLEDANDVKDAAELRFRVFNKLLNRDCFRAAFNALDFSFELLEQAYWLERNNRNG